MAKQAGFTGLSILYRLHKLYGFDYRNHCIFDVMHTVASGIVKKHLAFLFENDLLDRSTVQERLDMYPGLQNFSHHGIQASFPGWDFGKLRNSRNLLSPIQRYRWQAF